MPKQNPTPTGTNEQYSRPLNEQDRIDAALNRMAIRLDKVLSESVINQWHSDLANYPLQAIEYAADWCGKNLERWPKWKQFGLAIGDWMGRQEEASGSTYRPSRAEIEQRRRENMAWLQSPEAADLRELIHKLDEKMKMGRPKLYTKEQLEQFRKERR